MGQQLAMRGVQAVSCDDTVHAKLTGAADLVEQAARLVTEASNQLAGDLRRSKTREVRDELTWAVMDLEILAAVFTR